MLRCSSRLVHRLLIDGLLCKTIEKRVGPLLFLQRLLHQLRHLRLAAGLRPRDDRAIALNFVVLDRLGS